MADSFKPLPTDSFKPLNEGPRKIPQSQALPSLDSGSVLNKAIDFVRPFIGNAVGAGAAGLVGGLSGPAAPFTAPIAETQGYAGVDALLQHLKSGSEAPSSWGESLEEGEKEALANFIGGKIVKGLFRGAVAGGKAFLNADVPEIYKFKPTTSQALESYGYHSLATSAKFAEDFGATGAKATSLDRAGGAGFTQALGFANRLNGRMASTNQDPVKLADKIRETLDMGLTQQVRGGQSYQATEDAINILKGGKNPFSKLDDVIQDPNRLSKVLVAGQGLGTNVRRDLQSYQFMRMVNDATSEDAMGKVRINPSKIDKVWNDPDMKTSLDALYGKAGRERVTEFFQNLSHVQDKEATYPVAKKLWLMRGGFALGTSVLMGSLHGLESGGETLGLFLGAGALGRLLTNEKTARIVTAMAGGEKLSVSNTYAAHILTDALQGTSVAMLNADGKKTWGSLQEDPRTGETKFVEAK